jgi:hypothetical protein
LEAGDGVATTTSTTHQALHTGLLYNHFFQN